MTTPHQPSIDPDALCICGFAYKDHGDDPLGNCGCDGFEPTRAVFQVEAVNPRNNMYRVVGPHVRTHPMSAKMAIEMAHDLNRPAGTGEEIN